MFIECRGVRLHVEQYGAGGQPVLLLHGWGCSIRHFAPISEDLMKDRNGMFYKLASRQIAQ